MRYAIGIYTHTPYKVLIKLREAREFLVEKSLQSINQSDSTKTIFTLRGKATTYLLRNICSNNLSQKFIEIKTYRTITEKIIVVVVHTDTLL